MIHDAIQHVVDNHPAIVQNINDAIDYLKGKKTEKPAVDNKPNPDKPNPPPTMPPEPPKPLKPDDTLPPKPPEPPKPVKDDNKKDKIELVSRKWTNNPKNSDRPIVKGTLEVRIDDN